MIQMNQRKLWGLIHTFINIQTKDVKIIFSK